MPGRRLPSLSAPTLATERIVASVPARHEGRTEEGSCRQRRAARSLSKAGEAGAAQLLSEFLKSTSWSTPTGTSAKSARRSSGLAGGQCQV